MASASAANAPANRDSPETTADARRQTTPASHPTENCAIIKDNASAEHAGKRKRESNYRGPTCEDCPTCKGTCDLYKDCVQCRVFGTGALSEEECAQSKSF